MHCRRVAAQRYHHLMAAYMRTSAVYPPGDWRQPPITSHKATSLEPTPSRHTLGTFGICRRILTARPPATDKGFEALADTALRQPKVALTEREALDG
jgi:hypothetical protein